MSDAVRYPIGKFQFDRKITPEKRRAWIGQLAWAASRLRELAADLDEDQLNRRYRPEGWTVRQVIHHLADSHLNGVARIRLALTEDKPKIKTYDPEAWSHLHDASHADVGPSIAIVEGLHSRLVSLLESLDPEQFTAIVEHPEWGEFSVDANLQLYAWHSLHHLAHIENALKQT